MQPAVLRLTFCLSLVVPTVVLAQAAGGSGLSVQDTLGILVTNRGVQTGDFDRDQVAANATRDTLERALLAAITTLPVSGSSSGFVYRLNPTLGTVERTTDTFGPFFLERALTSGRGQASIGFTMQYAAFDALDGEDLRDGSFVTTANRFTDETTAFDLERISLAITTRTATVFGTVGISDRVDVSGVVPIVRLDLSGTRLNTYRGLNLLQASVTGRNMGLGDIAVRTKVRLTHDGPAAAAAGAELRLPTGREEDLMGAGKTALRLLGMGSAGSGAATVYGNVAFGFGGSGRELSSGGALTVAASPRLTLVGEFLLRRIEGIQAIDLVAEPHPRISGVETLRLLPGGEDQTSAYLATGFKWNVGATWLLQANVLMPLTDTGLTARITPAVALEYAFTK